MKVAVIPARGGSKRIPRKNIKHFGGKPMIAWSIEAAKSSAVFDRIIVSTDDVEIAEVAVSYGAEVPFSRPAELSDDFTATAEVVAHAIAWLREQGQSPTAVCCIYATAPLVQADDIKEALALFEAGGWQYVFSATTFAFSVFRACKQAANGGVEMLYPQHFSTRSQDLPEAIHDAGQFYWGHPDAWSEVKRFFAEWSTVVLLPRWRVQDIDTLEDWERAEVIASAMAKRGSTASEQRLHMTFNSEQEGFWATTYASEYIKKNSRFDHRSGSEAWKEMLRLTEGKIWKYLECGCSIGRNIEQLKEAMPDAKPSIIEISEVAFTSVSQRYELEHAFNGAILNSEFEHESFDLVFTMGVLIHVNPDQLLSHMEKMFLYSSRYILMGEYFNRTPISIDYQGEKDRLFKRDFGKLFIENFEVELVDYGFLWGHIYDSAGFDDITWWLFEKC